MPSDSSKTITYTVESAMLKDALYEYARSRSLTLSQLSRLALNEYVRRHKPRDDSPIAEKLHIWLQS